MKEIFGPSGALGIYRKTALEDIENIGEYFDELLHYKNDVDLAYRLQWAGHKSLFIPEVTCYHARGLGANRKRRGRSAFEKESSALGHQAVLLKNFSPEFSTYTKALSKSRNALVKTYITLFEADSRLGLKKISRRKK
jgi:GT2 family glycosyltransferase